MITFIGSLNMDISTRVHHLPALGETVLGGEATIGLGGKGVNQAVAAALLLQPNEPPVRLIASLGSDSFGNTAREQLSQYHLNLEQLHCSPRPTGIALISVDSNAQNHIVVAPGANADLEPQHVSPENLHNSRLVCISLEIPKATWQKAIRSARQIGAMVVVNASPLDKVTPEDLCGTDVLVVNQIEAIQLSGLANLTDLDLAKHLQKIAPKVVVTLGARGAVWVGDNEGYAPAYTIQALDTTGAGDTFCGALCVELAQGANLGSAVQTANVAGAICATRHGTVAAMPTRAEVNLVLLRNLESSSQESKF